MRAAVILLIKNNSETKEFHCSFIFTLFFLKRGNVYSSCAQKMFSKDKPMLVDKDVRFLYMLGFFFCSCFSSVRLSAVTSEVLHGVCKPIFDFVPNCLTVPYSSLCVPVVWCEDGDGEGVGRQTNMC